MNQHLSASQRQIKQLEQQLAIYEQMQREYNVFLNYVVAVHGIIPPGGKREDAVYTIEAEKLKLLQILPIRTEISTNDKHMTIIRVKPNHEDNKSRIIKP